jgi:hypothetical protein
MTPTDDFKLLIKNIHMYQRMGKMVSNMKISVQKIREIGSKERKLYFFGRGGGENHPSGIAVKK